VIALWNAQLKAASAATRATFKFQQAHALFERAWRKCSEAKKKAPRARNREIQRRYGGKQVNEPELSNNGGASPDERDSVRCDALGMRLEWAYEAESRRWRGWLKRAPEITLFILRLEDDRDDRCTLLGGVMPDEAERRHTRVLVHWAKMAAEWYLNDFEALLKAHTDKLTHEAGAKDV